MNTTSVNLKDNLFVTLGYQVPSQAKKLIAGHLSMMGSKELERFVDQLGQSSQDNPQFKDYSRTNGVKLNPRDSFISAINTIIAKTKSKIEFRDIRFTIYAID